ncbi:hypothetical protein J8273_3677 [Carpediemonas membranifera]|uniref:Uncharacterized protein n=1 Tax=Carpediemonas membranifera TaxID=201153 RepID=A0A8J6E081_9EUKA|nr:hypothetical protein J8273_3677 [Carpediemonas membranifera]|eukprot:KAG9394704.1 hypothetical protein J8273_3677 [Carpediemonas membranifera]
MPRTNSAMQTLLQQAWAAYSNRQYNISLSYLSQILANWPRSCPNAVRTAMGLCMLQLQPKDAVHFADRALEVQKDDPYALMLKALCIIATPWYEPHSISKAISLVGAAIAGVGSDISNIGKLLETSMLTRWGILSNSFDQNVASSLLAMLKNALGTTTNQDADAYIHYVTGLAHHIAGRPQQALTSYSLVAKKLPSPTDPRAATVAVRMAQCYVIVGQYRQALDALPKERTQERGVVEAVILGLLGRTDPTVRARAKEALDTATHVQPRSTLLHLVQATLLVESDPKGALESYRLALQTNDLTVKAGYTSAEFDAATYHNIGCLELHFAQGQNKRAATDRARALLLRSLSVCLGQPIAMADLAEIRLDAHLSTVPTYYAIGLSLEADRRLKEALGLYGALFRAVPALFEALVRIAFITLETGQPRKAMDILGHAAECARRAGRKAFLPMYCKAEIAGRNGLWEEAETVADALLAETDAEHRSHAMVLKGCIMYMRMSYQEFPEALEASARHHRVQRQTTADQATLDIAAQQFRAARAKALATADQATTQFRHVLEQLDKGHIAAANGLIIDMMRAGNFAPQPRVATLFGDLFEASGSTFVDALLNEAHTRLCLPHQAPRALALYRQALALPGCRVSRGTLLHWIATACYDSGDHSGCHAALLDALHLEPENLNTQFDVCINLMMLAKAAVRGLLRVEIRVEFAEVGAHTVPVGGFNDVEANKAEEIPAPQDLFKLSSLLAHSLTMLAAIEAEVALETYTGAISPDVIQRVRKQVGKFLAKLRPWSTRVEFGGRSFVPAVELERAIGKQGRMRRLRL